MKATTQGVTAKLFLGLPLTPDYKMLLNQSREWQDRASEAKPSGMKINIIDFRGKEYLGILIDDSITTNELKMSVLFCLDRFKLYFPAANIEGFRLTVFPQIFII